MHCENQSIIDEGCATERGSSGRYPSQVAGGDRTPDAALTEPVDRLPAGAGPSGRRDAPVATLLTTLSRPPCRPCHPLLVPLVNVVRVLGATLGPEYEIVLHDTSTSEPLVVELANAHVTGRTYDSPLTDFGREIITSPKYENTDFLANYPSRTADGKKMRSSAAIVRDDQRRIVGFLCINYDLTCMTMLQPLVEFLTRVEPLDAEAPETLTTTTPQDHLQRLLQEGIQAIGGTPVRFLNNQDRAALVQWLDAHGFFDIKGAVEMLSAETGKSKGTIYRDLREARVVSGREDRL